MPTLISYLDFFAPNFYVVYDPKTRRYLLIAKCGHRAMLSVAFRPTVLPLDAYDFDPDIDFTITDMKILTRGGPKLSNYEVQLLRALLPRAAEGA